MPLSQKRAAPRQRATLSHISKPLRSDISEYTTVADLCQGHIDVAGILAARARVSVPTARLFAELHGFGGAQ